MKLFFVLLLTTVTRAQNGCEAVDNLCATGAEACNFNATGGFDPECVDCFGVFCNTTNVSLSCVNSNLAPLMTACETCKTCDGAGACTVFVDNGVQGQNCNSATLDECDTCDGAGGCSSDNCTALNPDPECQTEACASGLCQFTFVADDTPCTGGTCWDGFCQEFDCVTDPCPPGEAPTVGCEIIINEVGECHPQINEIPCDVFNLTECCFCAGTPPPTPMPTPKPTVAPEDEDCDPVDELEIFQKTECAVHRTANGVYEFWVGIALPDSELAAIVDFGMYKNIRERGDCDNRITDLNTTFLDLFNESSYQTVNGPPFGTNEWLKVESNVSAASGNVYPFVSFHREFTGPSLLTCRDADNTTDLVEFSMTATSFVYTGSIFLYAVFPMNETEETEMFKYTHECGFNIDIGPKKGAVTITYLSVNADLEVFWVKSICDKNNDLHIIIETCVAPELTLTGINLLNSSNPNSTFTVEAYDGGLDSASVVPVGSGAGTGSAEVGVFPGDECVCLWFGYESMVNVTDITLENAAGDTVLIDLVVECSINVTALTDTEEFDCCLEQSEVNLTDTIAALRAGDFQIVIESGTEKIGGPVLAAAPPCDLSSGKCCQQWNVWQKDSIANAPVLEVIGVDWDIESIVNGSLSDIGGTQAEAWITIDIEKPCFEEIQEEDDILVECDVFADLNMTTPKVFDKEGFMNGTGTPVFHDCDPIFVSCAIQLGDDYCDFFDLSITDVMLCEGDVPNGLIRDCTQDGDCFNHECDVVGDCPIIELAWSTVTNATADACTANLCEYLLIAVPVADAVSPCDANDTATAISACEEAIAGLDVEPCLEVIGATCDTNETDTCSFRLLECNNTVPDDKIQNCNDIDCANSTCDVLTDCPEITFTFANGGSSVEDAIACTAGNVCRYQETAIPLSDQLPCTFGNISAVCQDILDASSMADCMTLSLGAHQLCSGSLSTMCGYDLTDCEVSAPPEACYPCIPGTEIYLLRNDTLQSSELIDKFQYEDLSEDFKNLTNCCLNTKVTWLIKNFAGNDQPIVAELGYCVNAKQMMGGKKRTISKKRTVMHPNADPFDTKHDLKEVLRYKSVCKPGDVFSHALGECVAMHSIDAMSTLQ